MNYLKIQTEKVLISINGYKTPKTVLTYIKKYQIIIGNPPFNTQIK